MESKFNYTNTYNRNNYCNITFRIQKNKREVLDQLVKSSHKSQNRLIIEALEKQYDIDLTSDGK